MSSKDNPATKVESGVGVQHVIVLRDDDGQRLDRWLQKHIPSLPQSLMYKVIRKGQLRIDGKRAKPDTKLNEGQTLRIPPLGTPNVGNQYKKYEKQMSDEDISFIRSIVIYDKGDIVAINKPFGLASQGGTKIKRHVDGLIEALKDKDGVKPRLVHRLDKDTSGVLLLARTAKMAKQLGTMFKKREIRKTYWALVAPPPELPEGTIKAPLAKSGAPGRERVFVDDKEGKFALTEFTVIETVLHTAAFIAFWPKTGRTHQIRAHAELMGCPIIGDPKYKRLPEMHEQADQPTFKDAIASVDFADRLHLHAYAVSFKHPETKQWVDIRAPLPYDLQKSWKALGLNYKFKGDPFADVETK